MRRLAFVFLFYLFLLFMQMTARIFLLDTKSEILYNALVETTGLD